MLVEELEFDRQLVLNSGHDFSEKVGSDKFWKQNLAAPEDELLLHVGDLLVLDLHEVVLQEGLFYLLKRLVDELRVDEVQFCGLDVEIELCLDFLELFGELRVDLHLINVDLNVGRLVVNILDRLLHRREPVDVTVRLPQAVVVDSFDFVFQFHVLAVHQFSDDFEVNC